MRLNPIKKKDESTEALMIQTMEANLKAIYSNKSSDEYKSHGDITASSEYKTIERMVTDLNSLKHFSKTEATNIKILFLTLHRPIFKKMVCEYLAKPNERNQIFTAVYTVGFRVLVGELSRIFASTEATDSGIVYKPDKISRKNNMARFIAQFNTSLEQRIDDYIRIAHTSGRDKHVQEASIEGIDKVVGLAVDAVATTFTVIGNIFRSAKELNPVALINAILSRSYDKKVSKFENVAAMYEATKSAYEDYMRIPDSQRKQKIESKYVKNMEKYNIKMNNLKAKIEHYDQRATEEAKDAVNNASSNTSTSTRTTTSASTSTSSDDNDDFVF